MRPLGVVVFTIRTNEATGRGFDMENLGMMYVKILNSVFRDYNKKSRVNAPNVLTIKIQRFLALHRHGQGKLLCDQAVTAPYILTILSNTNQDYTATSAEIGAEDND